MNINIKKIIIALITFCAIFLYYYIFNQSYSLIEYPYNNGLHNLAYYLSMISFSIGLGCLLFAIFSLIKNIIFKKKLFSKTIIVLLIIPILSYFFISSFLGGLIIEGESWDKQLVGNDKDEHGCIESAGYTWCEIKNKCLKTLEEECVEEEENNKKMTDEEAKEYFHATEIINNNLPESIEFWTEAYCPKSGTNFDYNFSILSSYIVDKCEQGETGSNGGCENCIMSKLLLHKKLQNENQGFIYGTIAKIQENDLNIPLSKKEEMLKQIFKGTTCTVSGNSISKIGDWEEKYDFIIDEVISSSFSAPEKNEKLFVLKGSGSHYRDNSIVFALFDENLNLLSVHEKLDHSCVFPDLFSHYVYAGYFYCDTTKTSYIVGVNGGCPNGGVCGDGDPKLLQFKNGKFIEIQNVNTLLSEKEEYPIYLYSINKNSISAYKWNFNLDNGFECLKPSCIEEYDVYNEKAAAIFLKELFFNNKTCRFE